MLPRLLKITGIFLLSAIALLVSILLLFKIFAPSYLIPYVIDQVDEETNGRYQLSVSADSLQIRFIDMSVSLGNTEFKRDSSVQTYSQIEFLDKFDVHAKFESFNIKAFNLLTYLLTDQMVLDEISLVRPEIVIRKNSTYLPQSPVGGQNPEGTGKSPTPIIESSASPLADSVAWKEFKLAGSKHLPHLKVKKFEIDDASFAFFSSQGTRPIQEVKGLTFDIIEFQLRRRSEVAVEDVSLTIDFFGSLLGKNTAMIKVHGAALHPTSFHIDSLFFGHIVDKYDINKIKGFRASWLDVGVKNIDLVGMHPASLINDSTIIVDKVAVGDLQLYLFKDKEEPKINPEHKPLPQEMIRNLDSQIMIDTFQLLNANLVIDMEAPQSHKPGRVDFYNTELFISNITNIEKELQKNHEMVVKLKSLLFGKFPIQLNYNLNLVSDANEFTAYCEVQPFDMKQLNGFIGSQFFVEFSDGYVDGLNFSFDGNKQANVGEMDFEYHDLKISKLSGYEEYLDGKPNTGFITGVGNIIIPKNRSKQQKGYKSAAVYYEKEFNRDLIHATIMSMVSGFMSSVGLSSKNVEKKREKAESLGEADIEKSSQKAQQDADKVDIQKAKELDKEAKEQAIQSEKTN